MARIRVRVSVQCRVRIWLQRELGLGLIIRVWVGLYFGVQLGVGHDDNEGEVC